MKTKPFNQEVHDACDPIAREAIINFMAKNWNRTAYPHPNKYKVDLVVENEFMVPVCYAEIEMRDWDFCPFDTVHVPSRKKKLVNNDLPTLYFVVSRGLQYAMWCKGEDIVASPLREVPNKAVATGEYFYDVPKNCFKHILL